ncbi:hypothetical protein ACNS7O_06595 [Haloferacaceae archaeon DSL9]
MSEERTADDVPPETTADDAQPEPARSDDPTATEVPDWDDEYLDRVSDRLMHNYDLVRDHRVRGETFPMYGEYRVHIQKQLFHQSLNYANHDAAEYLFVQRYDTLKLPDVEQAIDFARDLADDWIDADENHFSTDFTLAFVVDDFDDAVADFIDGFSGRTLLKFGYYGHYQINLVAVAPENERVAISDDADVAQAFVLWEELEPPTEGILSRFARGVWMRASR